jgi:hypothetical protein
MHKDLEDLPGGQAPWSNQVEESMVVSGYMLYNLILYDWLCSSAVRQVEFISFQWWFRH